jgi:hypothetical protein
MEMMMCARSCTGCVLRWFAPEVVEEAAKRASGARPSADRSVDAELQIDELERNFGRDWKW